MALFQIHPHFGYLNSDVKLVNSSSSSIVVNDSMDNKDYTIPGASSISIRLSAGKHSFTVIGNNDVSETVIVEDAIKLGGSKEKKSFVFEGTPWAIMVMLDRSYFFNRETNEQYIEHGLVPEQIHFLNKNYLLFVSKRDNSLFSLNKLSVEKTIGGSSFLFSNKHVAVFSIEGGLAIYSLEKGDADKLTTIICDDFTIDKQKQTLFYHIIDNSEILIRPLDSVDHNVTRYKLPTSFRCFIGEHSAIYGNSPQRLNIVNLHNSKPTLLYEGIIPVTTINGKEIWENSAVTLIKNEDIKDLFTSTAQLIVYERGDRWFYIRATSNIIKNKGLVNSMSDYCLCFTNENNTYLKSDKPFSIVKGNSFDCVKNNSDKGIIVFDQDVKEFEGDPVLSPKGYILISKADGNYTKLLTDPLNHNYKNYYSGYTEESLFRKAGLVIEKYFEIRSSNKGFSSINPYRDIESNRVLVGQHYEDLAFDGFFRMYGEEGDFIYSINGDVSTMPCLKDRLIAISEKCNYAIVRCEDGIQLLAFDPSKKEWTGTALNNMAIDNSIYSKAVFCSDGDNIIYQKGRNDYYLKQIGSDDETAFELQGSVIRRNINGYIPYIDFDERKRPVYVDPVSLTRIEYAAASQFSFQSIDGSISHVADNVTKYYSNEKKQYVTKENYDQYVAIFDYEKGPLNITLYSGPHYEEVQRNRRTFYFANKTWIDDILRSSCHATSSIKDQSCLEMFLNRDSVCDGIIFKLEYYVREKMGEEIIDIKLPLALRFLNYVSYSYDNKYIIVSGRFPEWDIHKGLALVYDVCARKTVYMSTSTMAVWLGVFSKKGAVAYYDSTPKTFVSDDVNNKDAYKEIQGRSFLTFSPSGKYMALSRQGYIPFASGNPHWGHQPSRDVYIVRSNDPRNELAHYFDHGDQIEGVGNDRTNSSVASATFSRDDTKLMTVSNDGVVVIRNLHFEKEEIPDISLDEVDYDFNNHSDYIDDLPF